MMEIDSPVLHHVEICVEDEKPLLKLFTNGMNFKLSGVRTCPNGYQWLLTSGHNRFLLNKKLNDSSTSPINQIQENGHSSEIEQVKTEDGSYPLIFCCNDKVHDIDRVFNAAIEVKNVDSVIERIKSEGGSVLIDPVTIKDCDGSVRFALVRSECENVVHSLIDRTAYKGDFLPGFKTANNTSLNIGLSLNDQGDHRILTSSSDHVTFVCNPGESTKLISWYERIFKMRRLFTNREETLENGFVLAGSIGLRLKALQFWRCAETGVESLSEINSPNVLRIVIAEPLPNSESSHVAQFLRRNGGPGMQHIGLNCEGIVEIVKEMSERGVKFRMPPPTYYEEISNLDLMVTDGLADNVDRIKESGILIDVEDSPGLKDIQLTRPRYLMQIFTHPIFAQDTFFLEVIERQGATGFGSGNITALAKSIIRHQEQLRTSKTPNK